MSSVLGKLLVLMNYQTNEKFIVSINLYRYRVVVMTVYGVASQPVDLLPALPSLSSHKALFLSCLLHAQTNQQKLQQ